MYKIVVKWYKNKSDIEANKPCKIVESGFIGLTLKEAYICKSKMSTDNCCGMYRTNNVIKI